MESQPLRVHVRIRDVVRKRSSSIEKVRIETKGKAEWTRNERKKKGISISTSKRRISS